GRTEIENLAPEEIRETNFTFNVKKSETPIDLEIQIIDEIFRDGITNKVAIPNNINVSDYRENKRNVLVKDDNTPIRGGGFTDAPIIARSQKGTNLRAVGQNKDWIKVNLHENILGWINKGKVQSLEDSDSTLSDNAQFQETFEAPPIISLNHLPLSTTSSIINLYGDINDRDGIELVSVFLGDNKVALLPSTKTNVSIFLELTLEEEINLITIIAKDSKGFLSKRSFVVRKEG
ncbi:MAG: hypothetical protein O6830_06725, partial [Candidatus Dadabacteria bacterium]|nr:hypothetical protein [Candidatus Dadabacteria bacterium]